MVDPKDSMLEEILDSMIVLEEGTIEFKEMPPLKYNMNLSILLSEIMLDNQFQRKLNKIRYFFTSENDVCLGTELNSIFKELKESDEHSFDKFKEKLEVQLEKIKKDVKTQIFNLYYPVNIKTDEEITQFNFRKFGIELKIVDYEDIKQLLNSKDVLEKFDGYVNFQKAKCKYIHVTIRARNEIYAQQIATEYVNLILGFLAFSHHYGKGKITIMGIPKPLTQLRLKYIFIFSEDRFLNYYYFGDKSDFKKIYELRKEDIKNLNIFINNFNTANKRVKKIILGAISSYYQGLLEREINHSYLYLWTALEIICLKNKGVPHAEIIKRLKSILINSTPLQEHKLDRLYSLRNNLIHNADYNHITQYDRYLLKMYAEAIISFFIFHLANKYNVSQINTIFHFLRKSNEELRNSGELIDFVIKLREGD